MLKHGDRGVMNIDELADIRRCVEWAIPQLNCGNMNADAYWNYLVFMFARVSDDALVREVTERLRLAESERDHLRYIARAAAREVAA